MHEQAKLPNLYFSRLVLCIGLKLRRKKINKNQALFVLLSVRKAVGGALIDNRKNTSLFKEGDFLAPIYNCFTSL